MHKILKHQIERYCNDPDTFIGEHKALIKSVSETYSDFESEYTRVERSLDISSKELTVINEKLQHEIMEVRNREAELKKFNELMVDRELKMVELKKQIKEFGG